MNPQIVSRLAIVVLYLVCIFVLHTPWILSTIVMVILIAVSQQMLPGSKNSSVDAGENSAS
jgi:energy-coupling factor transporter transmembrane protein EcfT